MMNACHRPKIENMRLGIARSVFLLALGIGICRADIGQLQTLYQSILSEPDQSRIPTGGDLAAQIPDEVVQAASEEEIQLLLPLGRKCLHSPMRSVQAAGLTLFASVALRVDSSRFIKDYIEDCALLLDSSDQGIKRGTIFVLQSGYPTSSPGALKHLGAHLDDPHDS